MKSEVLNNVNGAEKLAQVSKRFTEFFDEEPLLVKAPGRINLIGEHTDYNLGFVMPAAIDKAIYFAIAKSGDEDECFLHSLDQEESYSFSLSKLKPHAKGGWQNYILGVVAQLLEKGAKLSGFKMVFGGDIPQGAGLSSSAALECGAALGLNHLFSLGFSTKEMAFMAQKAEHTYVGAMCGIMDQFASMHGKQDQVMLLDCRSLEMEYFPSKLDGYAVLLCNSNVTHNLASSEYNVRRAQCEEAVAFLNAKYPGIESLRDVSMETLQKYKSELDPVVFKRCHYIIKENERVQAFGQALRDKDFTKLGALLYEAQSGMEKEYEITCPEIDFLARLTQKMPYVLGARMMGGGFGGCTINVVEEDKVEEFKQIITEQYQSKFKKSPSIYEVAIGNGASIL